MSSKFVVVFLLLIVVTEINARRSPLKQTWKACKFDKDYAAYKCPAIASNSTADICKDLKFHLQCRKDVMNQQCADKKQVDLTVNLARLALQIRYKCAL